MKKNPIEKNSKSIDKQTSVNYKYVMKYEKDIENIAKHVFLLLLKIIFHTLNLSCIIVIHLAIP